MILRKILQTIIITDFRKTYMHNLDMISFINDNTFVASRSIRYKIGAEESTICKKESGDNHSLYTNRSYWNVRIYGYSF